MLVKILATLRNFEIVRQFMISIVEACCQVKDILRICCEFDLINNKTGNTSLT